MKKKKHVSVVKTSVDTEDQGGKPAKITETVTTVAPKKRCHLCEDGGEGKPLVKVINAVRQEMYACQQHAAFYGRTRDNKNRKYLPGNEGNEELVGATAKSGNDDTAERVEESEAAPKVKLKDKK